MHSSATTIDKNESKRAAKNAPLQQPLPWWQSTWALAWLGNILLWAALPPLSLAALAWIAPVPWIVLIRRRELGGKHPYRTIWLSSAGFWLAALYWLTLPYWATGLLLLLLAGYLAFYLPAFIVLCRYALHAWRVSPLVAAPVVWVACELARAHVFTGFLMAALAHTQVNWIELIQISDLLGGYGVSFLVMLVAACLARMLSVDGSRFAWWPLVPGAAAVAGTLAYGYARLNDDTLSSGPRVALIQGSIDSTVKSDAAQAQAIFDEYFDLSRQAVRQGGQLDLIVWPETMFRYPWFTFDEGFTSPESADWTPQELKEKSQKAVENTATALGTNLLLGIESVHEGPNGARRYNSALFTDPTGAVLGRYDKYHLVPFGEFVPLANRLPWLYKLTPLADGLTRGAGPTAILIGNVRYAPNICYENTVPHLIRWQVAQLKSQGQEPDVLITLTNDGWFWGSTELDMHLACGVFRAIECRKPSLIAANTGLSAWIDSNGRIVGQGRRRATDVIIAQPQLDSRASWYLYYGDLPAGLCLLATSGLALAAVSGRLAVRKARPSGHLDGKES